MKIIAAISVAAAVFVLYEVFNLAWMAIELGVWTASCAQCTVKRG